ncbi:MAG: hypothetical protein NZM34_04115 [Bernardetiaceae bacterium]|nr:hypothetical protein [Bernardetiaceae bacterium]
MPVSKLELPVCDNHSGEVVGTKGEFVPSLFHEGLIVNIAAWSRRRWNELDIEHI